MDTMTRPNAYQLASMAECLEPDDLGSAGAKFLDSVYDATMEAIADGRTDQDAISAIADSVPDVYTYQRWLRFVDLGAWQEDTSDLGRGDDMTAKAGIALYLIAERLAAALIEEAGENTDDEE